MLASLPGGMPQNLSKIRSRNYDQCCCGNFWGYLMDEGRILPENISFIGVADYPGGPMRPAGEGLFQKRYLSFEDRGCRFFPLERFDQPYIKSLEKFVGERIKTPYLYVSLDLDVGSYSCTWAARYMDKPGITAQNLLDVASEIRKACRQKNTELAGFDIMEFNMHFLGIETDDGIKDTTLSLVGEFISMLTGAPGIARV
jgi:arginase family enzyme